MCKHPVNHVFPAQIPSSIFAAKRLCSAKKRLQMLYPTARNMVAVTRSVLRNWGFRRGSSITQNTSIPYCESDGKDMSDLLPREWVKRKE